MARWILSSKPSPALVAVLASLALARYDTDGSLDESFSGNGKLTTNLAEGLDSAEGIAIQVGGRIVAAGVAEATEARGGRPNVRRGPLPGRLTEQVRARWPRRFEGRALTTTGW